MYKVGDIVLRIVQPYPSSMFGASVNKGQVISIQDKTVVCCIHVDVERMMQFDKRTGINVNGIDYGFIVPAKSISWIFEELLR